MLNSETGFVNGLVSVIIPNYNHAHYIRHAIQSVLNQRYRNYELLVVDDGSTDNSREVISEFGDRVHYLWQSNQGLSAARNTGIRESRGEFVGLLDADDVWMPEYLATMVPVLASSEQIGAVYSGWRYIDSDGLVLPHVNIKTVPPEEFYQTFAFSNFLVPSGVMVRRRCFVELGLFDNRFRACEDRDMWLRISQVYKVVGVPHALVYYRVHPNNMTKDLNRMENARRGVCEKHFGEEAGDPATWPDIRRKAYGGFYFRTALDHFLVGNHEHGLRSLRRAFEIYPAISESMDTFYELSYSNQPPGIRGASETLDIDQRMKSIFSSLDYVFNNPSGSMELQSRKKQAYARAHLAIGLLAYGNGEMGKARKHIIQAICLYPALVTYSHSLPTLLKSFFGRKLLIALKKHL